MDDKLQCSVTIPKFNTHKLLLLNPPATPLPDVEDAPSVELRGLWVASVDNIDWPSLPSLTVQQQQDELLVYLDLMVKLHANCLFLQVRPVGDAFYESSIEPWSVYLTGEQGLPPSPLWDPLTFAVEQAHQRGIQVHAWINPYRAKVQVGFTDAYL